MKLVKDSEGNAHVWVNRDDVESAIRQFIVTCNPEYALGYSVNPFENEYVSGAFFEITKLAGRKGDHP